MGMIEMDQYLWKCHHVSLIIDFTLIRLIDWLTGTFLMWCRLQIRAIYSIYIWLQDFTMGDPVTLALGALQIVVPVAIAALPAIWKQITTILKRIQTMIKDSINSTNLVCIKTILDTLERVPNLEIQLSHNQPLLNKIKLKTEALEKALTRKTFQLRKFCRLVKDRIFQDIKEIALMMQLLDLNIRMRQYHEKPEVNISTQASIQVHCMLSYVHGICWPLEIFIKHLVHFSHSLAP